MLKDIHLLSVLRVLHRDIKNLNQCLRVNFLSLYPKSGHKKYSSLYKPSSAPSMTSTNEIW